MNKKISFPIAIIIIVVCAVLTGVIAWQYKLIPEIEIPSLTPSEKPPEDETADLTEKEQACIDSGGKISTSYCCNTTTDFPNLCLVGLGAPNCLAENSRRVKICDCGANKCFNGSECVFFEDDSVSAVTVTTDQIEYGYEWDDRWERGDTIEITIKNNSDRTICFTNCRPYYGEINKNNKWIEVVEVVCGCNTNFIAECINKQETKIFQKKITEIYSGNIYGPQGNYRIAVPIYIEYPGISPKNFYKIGKIVFSNAFTINARENPNKAPNDLRAVILEEAKKSSSRWGYSGAVEEFYYGSKAIDVNEDGLKEFIIKPDSINNVFIRGASDNGPFVIFQKIEEVWKKIGDMEGNSYFISEEKTDGYYDITTYWHLSAAHGDFCDYKWDKSKMLYYLVSCETTEPYVRPPG